jgi:hypothetical protein
MEINKFIIEKDFKTHSHLAGWCLYNFNSNCEIKYIYYTNVIPELIQFSFKNEEDLVLFKLTWE